MTGSIVTGGAEPLETGKIFPKYSTPPDGMHNFHVVPLVYNGVNYGFAMVGCREPVVYNKHLKRFCHSLALWCRVMRKTANEVSQINKSLITNQNSMNEEDREDRTKSQQNTDTVFGKKDNLMHKIKIENIIYFEALDKRVYAITKSGEYEVNQRLFEIEEMYANRRFMRISKSIIINMEKISSVKMEEDRSCKVFFSPHSWVRVSRNYLKDFRQRIGM